jgi:hypothetical protein
MSGTVTAAVIPAAAIRCRSAGRVRGFIRNRILLAGWRPRALPAAPGDAVAARELTELVGSAMLAPMRAALDGADTLAGRIGGCARDAYTVLYGCAGLAVLFAACGVAAAGNNTVLNLLVLAELLMLLVLIVTFRNAHRTNWHSHWLALRFHGEFLRCLPIMAAMRDDSMHARQAREGRDGSVDAPASTAPHLVALAAHHGRAVDPGAAEQAAAQRAIRAKLYEHLYARFLLHPEPYARRALAYARTLAGQQLRYHCFRAQQEQTIVHRAHKLSIGAFGLTIVAVIAHFWWHAALLTIICTGVPAFAASLHGFVAQEESERLAASYGAMAVRLQAWLDLGLDLDHADGALLPAMQERLAELVELMMSEVQDWHRLFGEKGMYHLG